jgi:hypothetical protein
MSEHKPEKLGLARFEDGRLQADLDRALTDKLLAQGDLGSALAQDFEAGARLMLPTLNDIDRTLMRAERPAHQSLQELESLLSLDLVGDISVEGMRLNELLMSGGASVHERSILKRGLVFLRRKMYLEAAEWWTLNRPKDALTNPRFYCLATLLLVFTYQLSGQAALAQGALEEAIKARKLI